MANIGYGTPRTERVSKEAIPNIKKKTTAHLAFLDRILIF
jgi:hypothetical protein